MRILVFGAGVIGSLYLRSGGLYGAARGRDAEIPANLRVLFLWPPAAFAVACWRRVFASPGGELGFGGHIRAAPCEPRTRMKTGYKRI